MQTLRVVRIQPGIGSELPNYDEIVPVLLEKGVKELSHHCKLRPGMYASVQYVRL